MATVTSVAAGTSAGTPLVLTLTDDVAAGEVVVVPVIFSGRFGQGWTDNAGITGVMFEDSQGNTWTVAQDQFYGYGIHGVAVSTLDNALSAGDTITATRSESGILSEHQATHAAGRALHVEGAAGAFSVYGMVGIGFGVCGAIDPDAGTYLDPDWWGGSDPGPGLAISLDNVVYGTEPEAGPSCGSGQWTSVSPPCTCSGAGSLGSTAHLGSGWTDMATQSHGNAASTLWARVSYGEFASAADARIGTDAPHNPGALGVYMALVEDGNGNGGPGPGGGPPGACAEGGCADPFDCDGIPEGGGTQYNPLPGDCMCVTCDTTDMPSNCCWWLWTPSETKSYAVNTYGSERDTVLTIYTGTSLDDLTEVASNDDDPTGRSSSGESALAFDATSGTQYVISVCASAEPGPIQLNLGPPRVVGVIDSSTVGQYVDLS